MLEVRRLEPHDDRTRFRSGNVDLDRFFLRYAGQNQFRHHIGTVARRWGSAVSLFTSRASRQPSRQRSANPEGAARAEP